MDRLRVLKSCAKKADDSFATKPDISIYSRQHSRPEIDQASAVVKDPARTESHLRTQPALYRRVEGVIRRAVLRHFEYSFFYVIEREQVIALAFPCVSREQVVEFLDQAKDRLAASAA